MLLIFFVILLLPDECNREFPAMLPAFWGLSYLASPLKNFNILTNLNIYLIPVNSLFATLLRFKWMLTYLKVIQSLLLTLLFLLRFFILWLLHFKIFNALTSKQILTRLFIKLFELKTDTYLFECNTNLLQCFKFDQVNFMKIYSYSSFLILFNYLPI